MALSNQDELNLLESVTHTYVTSESPQDRLIKSMAVRVFEPFLNKQGRALEFGCCDGYMTSLIKPLVGDMTVVDGSETFLAQTRQRVQGNIEFVHSLFEEFNASKPFDFVFATYVLEHVRDSVGFLQKAAAQLSDNGLLFIVVPNARALSRQLARHMGLLDDLFALTPNDINHGHRRVYDRVLLNRDIEQAGLVQVSQGGLLLKILADFQMDKLIENGVLGEPQQEGLFKMGLEYPELAGSLFAVCKRPTPNK